MDNKFMNLKKEYREFIKNAVTQIKTINLDDELDINKCKTIYQLYNNIHSNIESSDNLNVNDINHIILNYSRDDKDVELFKRFIVAKNMYIIKRIIKSNNWNSFISKLNSELNLGDPKLNKQKNDYLVAKGVYRLLNNYVNQFKGCWEIAEFEGDKVKRLEIIEPEHYEFLIEYLKNKINVIK
jgi:hypothetical protein